MQSGCLDGKVKSIFAKHDLLTYTLLLRGSTIGEGGDTTISSPGRSPKQPLPGMRLHDPLHGRQACPKFSQICPRSGLFSCRSLPKRGQICYTSPPPPPPIVELVCCLVKLFYSAGDHGQPRFYVYNLVWIHQMENNEGYDRRQKHDGIYNIMSTNILMRETQDILSCGASNTALEHDCGRRTAVICCCSQ